MCISNKLLYIFIYYWFLEQQHGVLGVIMVAVAKYVEMEYRRDSENATIQMQLVETVKDNPQVWLESVTMGNAVRTNILIFFW